jgi:hypothetical protein
MGELSRIFGQDEIAKISAVAARYRPQIVKSLHANLTDSFARCTKLFGLPEEGFTLAFASLTAPIVITVDRQLDDAQKSTLQLAANYFAVLTGQALQINAVNAPIMDVPAISFTVELPAPLGTDLTVPHLRKAQEHRRVIEAVCAGRARGEDFSRETIDHILSAANFCHYTVEFRPQSQTVKCVFDLPLMQLLETEKMMELHRLGKVCERNGFYLTISAQPGETTVAKFLKRLFGARAQRITVRRLADSNDLETVELQSAPALAAQLEMRAQQLTILLGMTLVICANSESGLVLLRPACSDAQLTPELLRQEYQWVQQRARSSGFNDLIPVKFELRGGEVTIDIGLSDVPKAMLRRCCRELRQALAGTHLWIRVQRARPEMLPIEPISESRLGRLIERVLTVPFLLTRDATRYTLTIHARREAIPEGQWNAFTVLRRCVGLLTPRITLEVQHILRDEDIRELIDATLRGRRFWCFERDEEAGILRIHVSSRISITENQIAAIARDSGYRVIIERIDNENEAKRLLGQRSVRRGELLPTLTSDEYRHIKESILGRFPAPLQPYLRVLPTVNTNTITIESEVFLPQSYIFHLKRELALVPRPVEIHLASRVTFPSEQLLCEVFDRILPTSFVVQHVQFSSAMDDLASTPTRIDLYVYALRDLAESSQTLTAWKSKLAKELSFPIHLYQMKLPRASVEKLRSMSPALRAVVAKSMDPEGGIDAHGVRLRLRDTFESPLRPFHREQFERRQCFLHRYYADFPSRIRDLTFYAVDPEQALAEDVFSVERLPGRVIIYRATPAVDPLGLWSNMGRAVMMRGRRVYNDNRGYREAGIVGGMRLPLVSAREQLAHIFAAGEVRPAIVQPLIFDESGRFCQALAPFIDIITNVETHIYDEVDAFVTEKPFWMVLSQIGMLLRSERLAEGMYGIGKDSSLSPAHRLIAEINFAADRALSKFFVRHKVPMLWQKHELMSEGIEPLLKWGEAFGIEGGISTASDSERQREFLKELVKRASLDCLRWPKVVEALKAVRAQGYTTNANQINLQCGEASLRMTGVMRRGSAFLCAVQATRFLSGLSPLPKPAVDNFEELITRAVRSNERFCLESARLKEELQLRLASRVTASEAHPDSATKTDT